MAATAFSFAHFHHIHPRYRPTNYVIDEIGVSLVVTVGIAAISAWRNAGSSNGDLEGPAA